MEGNGDGTRFLFSRGHWQLPERGRGWSLRLEEVGGLLRDPVLSVQDPSCGKCKESLHPSAELFWGLVLQGISSLFSPWELRFVSLRKQCLLIWKHEVHSEPAKITQRQMKNKEDALGRKHRGTAVFKKLIAL